MTARTIFAFALGLAAATAAAGETAPSSHADEILDRFRNAEKWKENILVVAHRGAAFREGVEVAAENSISSLNRAIALGVDMVEIDVRRTADGVFVISHDESYDRATNCKGEVAALPYDQIKDCRLLVGPQRTLTEEVVPTLEYFLEKAKGRVMVNLDNKVRPEDLADIYKVVDKVGMTDYVVTTIAANTPEDISKIESVQKALGPRVQLMPNVRDDKISGMDGIKKIYDDLDFEVMQTRNAYDKGPITQDGGLLFSAEAQKLADENDVHLWINTLSFPDTETPDLRAGGRGDTRAVTTGDLDGTYGFWAAHGATIFQTDEPELLIPYLERTGRRKPYTVEAQPAE